MQGPTSAHRKRAVHRRLFYKNAGARNLKAVWPFFLSESLKSGPGGPGKPSKMWVAKPPTFLRAFPGPRGRPDLKNAPKKTGQTAFKYPGPAKHSWLQGAPRHYGSQTSWVGLDTFVTNERPCTRRWAVGAVAPHFLLCNNLENRQAKQ